MQSDSKLEALTAEIKSRFKVKNGYLIWVNAGTRFVKAGNPVKGHTLFIDKTFAVTTMEIIDYLTKGIEPPVRVMTIDEYAAFKKGIKPSSVKNDAAATAADQDIGVRIRKEQWRTIQDIEGAVMDVAEAVVSARLGDDIKQILANQQAIIDLLKK